MPELQIIDASDKFEILLAVAGAVAHNAKLGCWKQHL